MFLCLYYSSNGPKKKKRFFSFFFSSLFTLYTSVLWQIFNLLQARNVTALTSIVNSNKQKDIFQSVLYSHFSTWFWNAEKEQDTAFRQFLLTQAPSELKELAEVSNIFITCITCMQILFSSFLEPFLGTKRSARTVSFGESESVSENRRAASRCLQRSL